jgi:signal transduction histidine kinase/PAS domain-containing protein
VEYLQEYLQLKQPGSVVAPRLRRWLIGINGLLIVISLFFAFLWFYFGQKGYVAPPFLPSLTTPASYGVCLWLAWRGRLWQSALLVAILFILATTITFFIIPAEGNLVVSLFVLNLIFVSVFLNKRMVAVFAVMSVLFFTALSFLNANASGLSFLELAFVSRYLLSVTVFVLAYFLVVFSINMNQLRSAALEASEARYRLLFEASPIALWEQDGSGAMARIEQLRQEGVQDFRAYFEQNPAVVLEMIETIEVLNVNETAVSLYKAKDKTELMTNLERFVPEESYSFILDSLESMANHESFFKREISNLTLDGELLTVLYQWIIPSGQVGSYTPVITSIVDMSERKEIEAVLQKYSGRLESLHDLDLAINVKKSPEEIADVALGFVTQLVPSCGADVWTYDEDAQTVSLLAQKITDREGERPLQDPHQPAASMLSEEMLDDMRNNRTYVVGDLGSLRYVPPALMTLKKAGFCSFIQIPLLVHGQPLGFLNIYDTAKDVYTPEYIGIARELAAPLAIALSNIQLYVLENIARNQAESLRRVASELNANLKVEPLLENILEYLQEVIPYDSATIFLEQEGALKIVAQHGFSDGMDFGNVELMEGRLGADLVYARGQPLIIPDTRKHLEWVDIPGMEYIRCWMGVPLKVKGKTIGTLTLDKSVARFYTEKNQQMAMAFANQAAVAIDNARLYQRSLQYAEDLEVRVNERTRDLMTLYEITAVASTHLSLEKILDKSLEILLNTLDCTSGAIFIKKEDDSFSLKSHKGVPAHILPIVSVFEYEDGFVKQILDNPTPLFIRDLATVSSLTHLKLPTGKYSYAGVSIKVKNDVAGILSIVHTDGKQFSPEDVALLSSVADQLGVVIENGRLRQQNQEVAILQERERMARELHDSVTQSLYSLTLFAEASKDQSKMGNSDKLREYLDDIGATAQQALKEMRLMLYELRSGALSEEGLANAIRYRLEAVEGRSGIEVNLEAEIEVDVPPELRRAFYLIAQEALNNTLKHAKATEVYVTLGMQGKTMIMTIEDNGRGFSDKTSKTGGMGLKTMRERIEAVGGDLNINSLLDIGTKIELSVDLEKYEAV